MTFDSRDILFVDLTIHTHIEIANGDCVHVDHEGPIAIHLLSIEKRPYDP